MKKDDGVVEGVLVLDKEGLAGDVWRVLDDT